MQTPLWFWLLFIASILALLALDLGVFHRKQREIKVGEALKMSFGYLLLAGLFCAGIFHFRGADAGYQFMAGYLIEWSLSVDNIFVFVLIFSHFAVPPQYQHRVLFWGILGALLMRGTMIWAGTHLIQSFHWVVFVFGAFLVASGVKMFLAADAKPDMANNRIVRFMRGRFRVTETYEGPRFVVRRAGKLWITPLAIVLVLIELTDLVFALDSIPAIFAVSQDPFIVYTANVFAILGLRALYFALAGVIHRFHYLKYGLAIVLCVVGVKMILNGVYGEKFLPTEWALGITAILIVGSMLLSLAKTRARTAPTDIGAVRALATGWVPGSPAQPPEETKH